MREISPHHPNQAVRLSVPAYYNHSSRDFPLCPTSNGRTLRVAYLSLDGSTDTGSSSSARAPLSRCSSDIPLLAVEQELKGYPDDFLPNLWLMAVGVSAAFILNNIKNIIRK